MARKSGPREPPRKPPDEDPQALDQRLEAARRDPTKLALVQILEWRLACAREEPKRLALDVRFMARLRLLAARLVGSNDGDDVAHDAFVNLLSWMRETPVPQIQELLDSENGVTRLVHRLTVCRAYDHHRRNTRRREDLTAHGDELELPSAGAHDTPPPFLAPEIERVEHAYAALTAVQRIAHVLHHYYGFTDTDFEETLGWNRATSRSLVHRANQALKRALGIEP